MPVRKAIAFVLLASLLGAAFACAVLYGEQALSLVDSLSTADPVTRQIFTLRLRRALVAALVGASLGSSGSALQALLRNPLADPFVLGASGGAALGVTVWLKLLLPLLGAVAVLDALGPSFFAFTGALGATAGAFLLGRVNGRSSPYTVLLAGTVLNAFALAGITLLRLIASSDSESSVLRWLIGALGYESPSRIAVAALICGSSMVALFLLSGRLNLLSLGDEEAQSLGVAVEPTRRLLLVVASLLVAAAVALSGLIGFIGLIVPHTLRLWLGADQRALIPASALGGATLLLFADTGVRLLFRVYPSELPVGVLTALFGVPFFLVLLHRGSVELPR